MQVTLLTNTQFYQTFIPTLRQQLLEQSYEQLFIQKIEQVLPHANFPIHAVKSTNHIMLFVAEGTLCVMANYKQVQIKSGEGIIIPANQVFCCDDYQWASGYILSFSPSFLTTSRKQLKLVEEFNFLHPFTTIKTQATVANGIRQGLERLYGEYRSEKSSSEQVLRA